MLQQGRICLKFDCCTRVGRQPQKKKSRQLCKVKSVEMTKYNELDEICVCICNIY